LKRVIPRAKAAQNSFISGKLATVLAKISWCRATISWCRSLPDPFVSSHRLVSTERPWGKEILWVLSE
jgi:hypothetical protein